MIRSKYEMKSNHASLYCLLWILKFAGFGIGLDAPTDVEIANVTTGGFTISFQADEESTAHHIQISAYFWSNDTTFIDTNDVLVQVTGLSSNVRYDTRVRSASRDGTTSNFSDINTVRTYPDGVEVVVSKPMTNIFTVFLEAVPGANEWILSVTNERTSVSIVEYSTSPVKIFRDMDPDTNYTIKARVGSVGNTRFDEQQSPFGESVQITTAQLSKFGRVILLNVSYSMDLENHSSVEYGAVETKWKERLRNEYYRKEPRITRVEILEFNNESTEGVICHHEIFFMGTTEVDNFTLLLDDSEWLEGCVITGDVRPHAQYVVFEDAVKTIDLDVDSPCGDLAYDQRYFAINSGNKFSDAEVVGIDRYRPEAKDPSIKLSQFEFVGLEMNDPTYGSLAELSPNTIYSVDQQYLLKYCQATDANSYLYSRRNGAYSSYTMIGYNDTFIHSTGPSAVDITNMAYTVTANRDGINLQMPAIYRAVSYLFDIEGTGEVGLRNLDSSKYVEASLKGFRSETEYCVKVSVTIQHPNATLERSNASCFKFFSGKPNGTFIRIIEVNSTRFTVQYSLIKFATSYVIEVSNMSHVRNFTSTDGHFTISKGISSGEVYLVRVATKNPFGLGPFSNAKYTKFWSFIDITNSSMGITWENETTDGQYEISVSQTRSRHLVNISTFEIQGLEAGETYEFTVSVIGSSPTLFTDSQITAPASPRNLVQTKKAPHKITAEADAVPSSIAYYVVLYNSTTLLVQTEPLPEPKVTLENLIGGSVFRLHMYAQNGGGYSSITELVVYTLPENVEDLTLHAGPDMVHANWSVSDGADLYHVRLYKRSFRLVDEFNVSATSCFFYDLDSGTIYQVEITAAGSTGESATTNGSTTTEKVIPKHLSASNVTDTNFTLTWTGVRGALLYTLVFTRVETRTAFNKTVNSSNTILNCYEMLPGTVYEAAILATYPEGDSAVSDPYRIITSPSIPVAMLTPGSFSINVAIRSTKGADNYILVSGSKRIVLSNLSYTFENMEAGTVHHILVASQNEGGTSGYASYSSATEKVIPQDLSATNVSSTNFTLTWTGIRGALLYTVMLTRLETRTVFNKTVNSSNTILSWYGMLPGTVHEAAILATYPEGNSAVSSPYAIITPPSIPVATLTPGPFSINVSIRSTKGADDYILMLGSKRIVLNNLSYTFDNLEAGTVYHILLASQNAGGMSGYASYSSVTETVKPKFVEVSSIANNSFVVTWNEIDGAKQYTVFVTSPANMTVSMNITGIPVKVTELIPGTIYSITVTATYSAGSTATTGPIYATTVPAMPSNVRVLQKAESWIAVTWNTTVGAIAYSIDVSDIGHTENLNLTWHNITNLLPGKSYVVQIRSLNSAGYSNPTVKQVQTLPATPHLVFSNATLTSVVVSWNASSETEKYNVTITGENGEILPGSGVTNDTSILVEGLTGSTVLVVQVVAISPGGSSEESAPLKFIAVPFKPSGVVLQSRTSTSLTVGWAKSGGASRYELQYDDKFVTTSSNFSVLGNLSVGTEYTIILKAIGLGGTSSNNTMTMFQTLPLSPTFEISSVNKSSIIVSWTNQSGAEKYSVILVDLHSGFLTGIKKLYKDYKTIENVITIKNLTAATTYNITVVSVVGSDSSEHPITIQFTTVCPKPQNVNVKVMHNSVTVAWAKVPRATEYKLNVEIQNEGSRSKRSSTGTFPVVPPGIAQNETTARIMNLEPVSDYKISLVAIYSAGSSSPVTINITTGASNPSELLIVNVSTTSVLISWLPQDGALLYRFHIAVRGASSYKRGNTSLESHEEKLLIPGFTYDIYLTTLSRVKPGGIFENSQLPPSKTVITIPNPPDNISIEAKQERHLTVSWSQSYGGVIYFVYAENNTAYNTTETTIVIPYDDNGVGDIVVEIAAMNAHGRISTRSEPKIFKRKDPTVTDKSWTDAIPWWVFLLASLAIALIIVCLIAWKIWKDREKKRKEESSSSYDFELARRNQEECKGTKAGEVANDDITLAKDPNQTQESSSDPEDKDTSNSGKGQLPSRELSGVIGPMTLPDDEEQKWPVAQPRHSNDDTPGCGTDSDSSSSTSNEYPIPNDPIYAKVKKKRVSTNTEDEE